MGIMKDFIKNLVRRATPRSHPARPFPGSAAYWENRYSEGANSGAGSYDLLAGFKAEVLNGFIAKHQLQTVIEFGCGDGNQLTIANYPSYLGFDVSSTAIRTCKALFESDDTKSFRLVSEYDGDVADVALSLDVIYHLVEDDAFESYMEMLFKSSSKYVIIYSSNFESKPGDTSSHVRHREFTKWIKKNMAASRRVRSRRSPRPACASRPMRISSRCAKTSARWPAGIATGSHARCWCSC